jgi:hypothetical protein
MEDLSIRRIIELIENGQMRIPIFQRGFVWDDERVAYLMDSIYKDYPLGAVILWRTREALKSERQLGPFELPERDPEYPLDYVLDGQQRLTSIFGVFQTSLRPLVDAPWTHVYFDFEAVEDAQESQFVVLNPESVDLARFFPVNTFFDVTGYRKATENLSSDRQELIDKVQAKFKEAKIPVQQIATNDRAKVAIVFERVNRLGVELDIFQLLSAWTWSEDFDLQSQFGNLAEELEPFGFQSIGEDSNLLLRCCASVVAGEAAPEKLIGLNGGEVRDQFPQITNGIRGAIDFLKANLNVENVRNLPYATLIVPLCAFFAVPDKTQLKISDEQRETLVKWFWRACFSRRYSAGVIRNLKRDIGESMKLRQTGHSSLAEFSVSVTSEYFTGQTFNLNTVGTRTFILMLAAKGPKSFISGQPIKLTPVLQAYNRNEFHHLYPKAYLIGQGIDDSRINALVNFTFMSRSDNNVLGGVAPSVYRARMEGRSVDSILRSAQVPNSLFDDDYEQFIATRSSMLLRTANGLIS